MGSESTLKIVVPLAGAAIATALCFYIMYILISVEIKPVTGESIRISAPLKLPERRPESREVREKVEKVLPTEPPPGPDDLPQFPDVEVPKSLLINMGSLAERIDQDVIAMEFAPPIKDLVPVIVVQPIYPFKAMIKEIEGHVTVQFTVREDGSVINPFVVDSEPDDIFDKAALKAIQQFRFQPRQAGGDPLAVPAVRMRFAFQLTSPYAN